MRHKPRFRWSDACTGFSRSQFELELIQTHVVQKPVLRVEVGARALRVRLVSREVAWASVGVYLAEINAGLVL